jgi:Restriction endonuclease NaeI
LKKKIPESQVVPGHPDFELLSGIANTLREIVGGQEKIRETVPPLLREIVDDVIQTRRTGRRSYDELEKTEKTYIGTRVEIVLRALFKLPKGRLDTVIDGHDVDIKHTMVSNWMIPTEALGEICILVAADEEQGLCYLGLIVARPDNLTSGGNRDSKVSVSAAGFANIYWLLVEEPYPANFWRTVASDKIYRIFSGATGNDKVVALFTELQGIPISRDVVEGVAAPQKDFMRRIRADGRAGTRNRLARQGILLLSGAYDKDAIAFFGLPMADFISYSPSTLPELAYARSSGYKLY